MVPQIEPVIDLNKTYNTHETSRTYKLDNEVIADYVEGINSVKQSCYAMLSTYRYRWIIYSWNYGFEIEDLIGMDTAYVIPELDRRITECLMTDDRIVSVTDFRFSVEKDTVKCTFNVNTIYGTFEGEKEVEI